MPWTDVKKRTDIAFEGLTLENGEYIFSVKATSYSDNESEEVSASLFYVGGDPVVASRKYSPHPPPPQLYPLILFHSNVWRRYFIASPPSQSVSFK